MKSICVFCGSSIGNNSQYVAAARNLGKLLAQKKLALVYGGGNVGLMGEIANSVLANRGKAIGVIPRFLVERELVHEKLSEIRIVESMHERKALMAELADGFIAMPGGFGTLEETVEVLTWAQLRLNEKFLHSEYKDMILINENAAEMLNSLAGFQLPDVDIWGDLQKV